MSLPPNLDPRYPTTVSVVLIVAGAVLVAGCLGLQYLPGSDVIRAICTIGGAVVGVLMIVSGAQGANLRKPTKWPGEQ